MIDLRLFTRLKEIIITNVLQGCFIKRNNHQSIYLLYNTFKYFGKVNFQDSNWMKIKHAGLVVMRSQSTTFILIFIQ